MVIDHPLRRPAPPNDWTVDSMPDQTGRTVVVTGANSGLGFEAAKTFAQKGAHVVMACRNRERANRARQNITATTDDPTLTVLELDLGDLSSVRSFADEFDGRFDRLDVLVNNAGVMITPYSTTTDGFERQFGVNHLGHFALTGLCLDHLVGTDGETRVVTVSSVFHRYGEIDFEDIHHREEYDRFGAYSQSKLANLLFTYELDRRLRAAGANTIAVAAHPGWAATGLLAGDAEQGDSLPRRMLARLLNGLFAQPAAAGVRPTLYAAAAQNVDGGHYVGPDGVLERRGPPTRVTSSPPSYDHDLAQRLWDVSESLTGVSIDVAGSTTDTGCADQ